MTNSIEEIEQAKVMLVIGSNTTEAHPVIGYAMKRAHRRGATLVVCDPRTIDLCRWADVHVQHRVGTDIALINGLMREIIDQGWEDAAFIEQHTEGYEALLESLAAWPVERAAEVAGVPADLIRRVARILGEAESAGAYYTLGITEHITGTANVTALANLQMLLGNIGRPGAGLNPLRGQNNVQGACDVGALPNVYQNYQKVGDPEVVAKFERAWGREASPGRPGLPTAVGRTMRTMLSGIEDGSVRALFLFGENLVASEPNTAYTRACLAAAEFVIASDIFETETTAMADVVLPATCWAELDGTFTSTERRVQRVRPALRPPGEARDDWWIFTELGRRLGYDMGFASSAEVFEELRELGTTYHGITWQRCEDAGIQWPAPTLDHPGTPMLHAGGQFTRGRGKFTPTEWLPPAEAPDDAYPLVLSTGRRLWHYQTATQTRRSAGFEEVCGEELIELSPVDASRLGIADGDLVRVSSRRGALQVRAWVSRRSPPGVCWMAFHFGEANANVLTLETGDAVTETPELKHCAVRVDKVRAWP